MSLSQGYKKKMLNFSIAKFDRIIEYVDKRITLIKENEIHLHLQFFLVTNKLPLLTCFLREC